MRSEVNARSVVLDPSALRVACCSVLDGLAVCLIDNGTESVSPLFKLGLVGRLHKKKIKIYIYILFFLPPEPFIPLPSSPHRPPPPCNAVPSKYPFSSDHTWCPRRCGAVDPSTRCGFKRDLARGDDVRVMGYRGSVSRVQSRRRPRLSRRPPSMKISVYFRITV